MCVPTDKTGITSWWWRDRGALPNYATRLGLTLMVVAGYALSYLR